MSNEDKRRRRDGSTTQLSVADLIARREAETQPIPIIRIDDVDDAPAEDTVRFKPVKTTSLSGRELHVAELLRREGRPADEERAGGLSMSRLVALASGGVVLCGSVAFGATQWLSSPDERPLADVRFDTRPAARATNSQGTVDLSAAGQQQQAPASTTTDPTTQAKVAQQPATKRPVKATEQPGTGTPTTDPTTANPTTPSESTSNPPPPETTTPPSTTTPTPSDSVPPTSSTTPPPSSSEPPPSSTPAPEPTGIGIGLDLGKILEPLGGFDFFAA